ncbi:hypothetical protein [Parabacteroides distasonis]|uniref:hypothetical protein n=1 Tax=Parabacteroides distasonis TaxID=823 RepID=UPI0039B38D34
MKKYWHIALMLFCVLMITSCGDDEALEVDEVWKVQNEEAFQAQMLVPGFEQLSSQSNAGFILYKVLKTGESKEPIYYVIIKGRLLMERFLMINRLRQVPLPSLLFLRW